MWAVRASRSYLTPVVTKKIGMKIPKPAASSLRRKSGWVIARSRSTSEMIAPAMKAPRMTSSPSSVASATSPMSRTKARADADLRGGVLQAAQDVAQAPGVLDARDQQRDEHGDHEQPAEQDDLRRGGARLAREEEREQDHGGEVGDRARGDDELPEGRPDLVGVLEHGHEHAQRGGRQHDGHEQRLGGQAARLQRQPDDDRESRARRQSPAARAAGRARAGARSRSPGRRGRAGRPARRSRRPARGRPHGPTRAPRARRGSRARSRSRPRGRARTARSRAPSGAANPIATMMSRFVKVSSMTLRSHRGPACRYA